MAYHTVDSSENENVDANAADLLGEVEALRRRLAALEKRLLREPTPAPADKIVRRRALGLGVLASLFALIGRSSAPARAADALTIEPDHVGIGTLQVAKNLTADTLQVAKGLTADTLKVSKNLTADTLTVSKGLTADTLQVSKGLTADTLQVSKGLTADTLQVSKGLTADTLQASKGLTVTGAPVPVATESLRIIRGMITKTGQKSGEGFNVSQISDTYIINFAPPFTSVPAAVTQFSELSGTGRTRIGVITPDRMTVLPEGQNNSGFSFIVIGTR